jgi:hypothetical protein
MGPPAAGRLASRPVRPHPDRSVRGPQRPLTRIDRRTLLRTGIGGLGVAALGSATLGACGSGDTVADGINAGPSRSLTPLFPRDVKHVGSAVPTRLPYTLVDNEGVPVERLEGDWTFRVSFDGEEVGAPVTSGPRSEGLLRPYVPLVFTFPRPGLYDIDVEAGGERLNSQLQVYPADEIRQPQVGDTLPPADTPTVDESYDVDPICTSVPRCPFHEQNLADALGGDKPVVLLLASPAYCRTMTCGPVLELLMEEAGDRDDLVIIHAEVYKNPKEVRDLADAALAPLPKEYAMPFEPSLFVTDAAHTIVARADIVVDRSELTELLELAV